MKSLGSLQVIIFIASIIFIFFAIDLVKRKKFNFLHLIIFGGGSLMVMIFAYDNSLLNAFGKYFGLQRGADLLVYTSIIILFYLFFSLTNKQIKLSIEQTNILRHIALSQREGDLNPGTTIALIMPCYRNHAQLDFLKKILKAGYGIVFVDDGYNTKELIDEVKKLTQTNNIVLISHPHNLGQGAALQTGQDYIYYHTQVPYIMHFDSDGQHDIKDIPQFLEAFKQNPQTDIVLGSRFLGIVSDMSTWRRFHKKLQILFSKIVIGLPLTDTHNGLRMIRYKALPQLKISLNDYTHASEIESLIKSNKLKWKEVPMHVLYTQEQVKNGQPLSNALTIAKNIIYRTLFFR